MVFNSYPFAIFLAVTLPLYWLLADRFRQPFLIAASLVFYAMWIPQYVLLLLFILSVNYLFLLGVTRSSHGRWYVVASIVFSLGMLAYFKYAAFIVDTFAPVLTALHGGPVKRPDVLLPLGISFFTFQIIGLAVDGYRRRGVIATRFRDYLLFIGFFPHQIAGPILRGWDLLPQFRRGPIIDADRVRRGVWLIVGGLFKKTIFADALLAPYVNQVFAAPGFSSAPDHLMAMYSFAFQIYFDFSGYTDIARGTALLFGYELPLNFREPYLSRDPSEFWRRWHITLSTWLRDYLYIPLGGNRGGRARVYANLMITMVLGGLWHGAGWNFLIWGGIHGALLVGHRVAFGRQRDTESPLSIRDLPAILVLFHCVCFAWIFFRAPSFGDAAAFLGKLFGGSYMAGWPVLQCIVVALCVALHPIERFMRTGAPKLRAYASSPVPALAESLVIGVVLGLVALFGGFGGEFIYFQF